MWRLWIIMAAIGAMTAMEAWRHIRRRNAPPPVSFSDAATVGIFFACPHSARRVYYWDGTEFPGPWNPFPELMPARWPRLECRK